MSQARWQRAKQLFNEALDQPEAARDEWLESACADDLELLTDVRRRLEWDASTSDEFLSSPLQLSTLRMGAPAPTLEAGSLLAGRYRLGAELGEGSCGRVFLARDELLELDVAAKLLPLTGGDSAYLREVAALRLLDVPGLLPLLDDGEDQGCRFLITPLVEGGPFGEGAPHRWQDLSSTAIALLETVGRMHAAGLVHRDLKPANVLVTSEGLPQVLDLGLAQHLGTEDHPGHIAGTPAYLSPEQLRGGEATARSDLYAIGLMLHEVLAGQPAHPVDTYEGLLEARLGSPAPPLASRAKDCPPKVAALVDALLADEPTERPADAVEALHLLGLESRFADAPAELAELARSRAGEPIDDETLRTFVHGPDRVLHLREDAAACALARSDGTHAGVLAEMGAWVRGGRARWDEGRLRITRLELDRLSMGEAGTDLLVAALGLRERGRPGASAGLLTQLLAVTRLEPSRRLPQEAVDELVHATLEAGEQRTLARALAETEALAARRPDLVDVLRSALVLLRAGRLVFAGGAQRAYRRLQELGPLESRRLEYSRRNLLLIAARSLGPEHHANEVAAIIAWSDGAADRAADRLAHVARGWLAYLTADYGVAATWHERAASLAATPAEELSSELSAASALLEDFQLEAAKRPASRALRLASTHRMANPELQSWYILREAAYRAGDEVASDDELVQAAEQNEQAVRAGPVLLAEAAFAWRGGRLADAVRLAAAAEAQWRLAQRPGIALLPAALAVDCGGDGDPEALASELLELQAGLPPGVVAQTAALLIRSVREPGPLRGLVLRCGDEIPREHRHRRREVLSVDECHERAGGGN